VAAIRWLLVFLLWAVLDLSGAIFLVPVEALEESEDVAQRPVLRRRDRRPDLRATPAGRQDVDRAARLSRLVATAAPRRAPETRAARKLPQPDADSGSPADDH
jgi:hypothetical protein